MSQQQLLTTQKLVGQLDRPIDFSNPQAVAPPGTPAAAQNAPQLEFVQCHGEAMLDGTQTDENGQRSSMQQMQVFDLSIHRPSGAIRGKGPGWVRYVGRTPEGGGAGRINLPGQPPASQATDRPRSPFTYVHVTFQRELNGNLNSRTMTFNETKTVYAPVDNWNARLDGEKPDTLGPEGMVLDARQLTIRQMPPRMRGEEGWFELVALGNVLAEGATFVAVGHRATYSQDKDHLVLEGDGRSPAELSYTPVPGGPRSSTKVERLIYSLGKQHIIFTGTHPFNFEAPAHLRSRKPTTSSCPRPYPSPLASSASTASRPVMPTFTPRASAVRLTSRILASNRSSGSHNGWAGVPRAIATARSNSLAARIS